MKCSKCNREFNDNLHECPHCIKTDKPSISLTDSAVNKIDQTHTTNIYEAGGAAVGGSIIINNNTDPSGTRSTKTPEFQYEQHIMNILQSGGSLERARKQLDQLRSDLGLTLKQTKELEGICLATFKQVSPNPVKVTETDSGHSISIHQHTSSSKRLPWFIILGCLVVVGVVALTIMLTKTPSPLNSIPTVLSNPIQSPNSISNPSSLVNTSSIPKYSLSIRTTPPSAGSVSPDSGMFDEGSIVTLIANPAYGFQFSNWSGGISGNNPSITVNMNSSKQITATFVPIQYRLSVSTDPQGIGVVSPISGNYDAGQSVTVSASVDFPYVFDHWIGSDNNSINPSTITMDTSKSIVAYFTELKPGETQSKSGMLYNNGNPKPVIPLKAGQWAIIGITLTPNSYVSLLDPYFGVIKDFKLTSTTSYTFKAEKTGDYTVNIDANAVFGTGYTLKYTIYSLPQSQLTAATVTSPVPTSEVVIKESLQTGDDSDSTTWEPSQIRGQRWTPSSGYSLTCIEVFMRRIGQPGNATLIVKATDGNEPIGPELAKVSVAASNIPMTNSWIKFDVQGINLQSGKTYWWGIFAESGSSSSNFYALRADTNNGYPNGAMWNSSSGVKQPFPLYDDLFSIYGR